MWCTISLVVNVRHQCYVHFHCFIFNIIVVHCRCTPSFILFRTLSN
ncbi:unnamed protein product [Arabidopsis halleri]